MCLCNVKTLKAYKCITADKWMRFLRFHLLGLIKVECVWGSDDDEVNPEESWSAWWVEAPSTTVTIKSDLFQSILIILSSIFLSSGVIYSFFNLVLQYRCLSTSRRKSYPPRNTSTWDVRGMFGLISFYHIKFHNSNILQFVFLLLTLFY